jgi:hypothetical protein
MYIIPKNEKKIKPRLLKGNLGFCAIIAES